MDLFISMVKNTINKQWQKLTMKKLYNSNSLTMLIHLKNKHQKEMTKDGLSKINKILKIVNSWWIRPENIDKLSRM